MRDCSRRGQLAPTRHPLLLELRALLTQSPLRAPPWPWMPHCPQMAAGQGVNEALQAYLV